MLAVYMMNVVSALKQLFTMLTDQSHAATSNFFTGDRNRLANARREEVRCTNRQWRGMHSTAQTKQKKIRICL